ncbi:ABC transporter permease [Pseudooceanicola sp. CBS1P-1]|uniref:ABC transporter permease subunit n=1 Tax=Pseudooceanicola albus TaxID=2692189 RepID=A0A6L7G9D1_9RHOB|nr:MULTISPECIES: ABC transporter permease [Pseudooceanicola]MBT9386575.1 ABC transporter permease [Pseudooceanicola endophyticus]MXN20691.1 ABC transporter permease subunit [Pseudooceanicola albus]
MTTVATNATDRPLARVSRTARAMLRPAELYLLFLVLLIVAGPWVAPFSAYDFNASASLLGPSWVHPFGTDEFGRDILSRVLVGARPTLLPAFAAATLGIAAGTVTGLVCGLFGGRVDELIMRSMDILLSFPALILAMLIVTMMGSSIVNLVLAMSLIFWPRSARLIRSAALEIGKREFIEACRARGESLGFILFREMLPNLRSVVIIDLALRSSYAILLSASLAYLGMGAQTPTPAWGLMVKEGQQFIQFAPWLTVFPCLVVAVIATGTVLIGESVRQRFAISTRLAR